MRRPSARSYSTWLRCCSPDKQAAQFARTHRLRRKLSEPRNAGHRTAASLCSQRMTSEGDSESIRFIRSMCPQTHAHVKKTAHENCEKPAILKAIMRFATETRLVQIDASRRSPALFAGLGAAFVAS